MQPLVASLPIFAISYIYCVWHAYRHEAKRRHRVLRDRVAYMLWVAANSIV